MLSAWAEGSQSEYYELIISGNRFTLFQFFHLIFIYLCTGTVFMFICLIKIVIGSLENAQRNATKWKWKKKKKGRKQNRKAETEAKTGRTSKQIIIMMNEMNALNEIVLFTLNNWQSNESDKYIYWMVWRPIIWLSRMFKVCYYFVFCFVFVHFWLLLN